VVSDELFMRAIQDNFGFDEAVILAVNAGTDILLFNTNKYNDMSLVRYLVDLISRKVEDGTIATSVIDAAYNRILKLKKERIPTSTEDLLAEHSHQQPGEIQIKNYPNPFNPATTLEIQLAETQHLSVEIFNMMGQKIQTLADNSFSAGVQTFHFDGSKLASGIYLVRVTGEQTQQLHKMTLVK
jgi:beta-N-acetylhexosaminidase